MSEDSPDKILDHFSARLKEKEDGFTGVVIPDHIIIKVYQNYRHAWSPQLILSLEGKDKGTLIRGLYGPNPTIWAAFFFGYAILGIIALFTGMIGLSQWYLGLDAVWLLAVPICAIAAIILYLIAQTGQKIGAQQMFDLHHFYEETIRDKVLIN